MKKVAIIGYSGKISKNLESICISLGEALADKYIVLTGGRDGVMEVVAKGVKKANGICIGILPFDEKGNPHNSLDIVTGLDFQMRSFILLKNANAVISIGGEIGTAIEILGAYAYAKPTILFKGTGGWTDKIQNVLIDGKYLDNRKIMELRFADNIEKILKLLEELI
ncbi:hypothetical protein SU69_02385 [Thermosipho melanesiensis]|uniref:TIGR00725 family protein n=2 Tax=Thermosipho melanesiensis TaxID=46541 RepID=A6LK78_THEM4|nr:TIGR00725 family protein [Thermosipho melanesiensis]ABR30329.1 conserved hypothetical protein 730 [Thermosipho melanesiensis BI429]APT73495.1 hypothetical protein BW47_02490 [Thermosipho melanesiensis]OOC37445.1 hypothetical protein SU68_02395 [Thermosipho melanesiensis]OOC39807.1 hypothetical protein SU69_02385 [Thermosipho melanesiensis]OOC39912.1 hypothetical protein SU70_02380 [Thermosipho melanesiensis]